LDYGIVVCCGVGSMPGGEVDGVYRKSTH